jgi:hypothetical protein
MHIIIVAYGLTIIGIASKAHYSRSITINTHVQIPFSGVQHPRIPPQPQTVTAVIRQRHIQPTTFTMIAAEHLT